MYMGFYQYLPFAGLSVGVLLTIFIIINQSNDSYQNPTQGFFDSPDPGVIRDVDGTYYATTTGGWDGKSYPIWKSTNLGNWAMVGFGLNSNPAWASRDFWAPQIHRVRTSYNLYYTARATDGRLSIGVAYSDHIIGPYVDIGKPLWQHDDLGIIDATFHTYNNINYLIYKTDGNAVGKPTQIYAIQLNYNGRQITGNKTLLLKNSLPWEKGIIQAPWIIYQHAQYYLFYSSCGYDNKCYSVSVARSKAFLGPYEKYNKTILATKDPQTNVSLEGPGHCSVIKGINGNWAMVYHAWPHNAIGTKRLMMLDQITWTPDKWPIVGSPSQDSRLIP